jgi:hypothetical protein
MVNNYYNDININILKKKKSFTGFLSKRSNNYNKKLIKLNILKECYKNGNKYASKFSFVENNIKIKKFSNGFKYNFK